MIGANRLKIFGESPNVSPQNTSLSSYCTVRLCKVSEECSQLPDSFQIYGFIENCSMLSYMKAFSLSLFAVLFFIESIIKNSLNFSSTNMFSFILASLILTYSSRIRTVGLHPRPVWPMSFTKSFFRPTPSLICNDRKYIFYVVRAKNWQHLYYPDSGMLVLILLSRIVVLLIPDIPLVYKRQHFV